MSSSETSIEPLYVVDTHALIWYLTDADKLGADAAQIFSAAEEGETRLIIPAVVLAEMYYANHKHKWFSDFVAMYERLKITPYFRFVSFDAEHVIDFSQDAAIPEMHDRIIVGVDRRLSAPLLTVDAAIQQTELISIVW